MGDVVPDDGAAGGIAPWPRGATARRRFVSMDGGIAVAAELQRPDRYGWFQTAREVRPLIPRGAGMSFAAASFAADTVSIDFTAFDRILDFATATGVVEVEAGIRLGALFDFLAARGRYLPIQPGHPAITVGGCVAADIHGKNPARDGSFIAQVESLKLFHPDHGTVEASEDKERELFRATCGGLGLTGIIVSARLRSKPMPAATLDVTRRRVANAGEAAALLRSSSAERDLVYGWLDLARSGAKFGGGYVMLGDFSARPDRGAAKPLASSRFSSEARARLPLPLLNRWGAWAVNGAYRVKLGISGGGSSLADAQFPRGASEMFYRLFGRAGFHEYQAIVADARYPDYLAFIHEQAKRLDVVLCLGVAKPFAGTSDFLRFAGDGISVAVEVPRGGRSDAFMAELDRFIVAEGGRPNLIKDGRLPREVADATYPEIERFRAFRRAWDKGGRFRSELSLRLAL